MCIFHHVLGKERERLHKYVQEHDALRMNKCRRALLQAQPPHYCYLYAKSLGAGRFLKSRTYSMVIVETRINKPWGACHSTDGPYLAI